MIDERYVYVNDLKEKKQTARSAHNKRTHCGKGGSVRLPSDNMTRKELKAMSGEVNTYRLNDPMKWAEFKALPDDLKTAYIKLIREKFGAPASAIANMLGVSVATYKIEIKRLELGDGRGKHDRHWKADDFSLWAFGEKSEPEQKTKTTHTVQSGLQFEPSLLPASGVVTYEGDARKALESLARLFGAEPVRISISWDKMPQIVKEAAE